MSNPTESISKAVAVRKEANTIRLAAQLPAQAWPDERISAVAKTVAPKGTGLSELALFLAVAHRYDLDPFVNEIWLVKDEKKGKLTVMTGRDAYLKIAMRDPGFKGINSGVVYEKDTFTQLKTEDGKVEIHHEIHSMSSRGSIVGAYCVAYHKDRIPVAVVRTWNHYKKLHGRITWQSNPDDMIETRVIVAALRRMFNISGLYTEAEFAGVDEGDGALQALHTNENALQATQDRVEELRRQMEVLQAREAVDDDSEPIQDAVVIEEDEEDEEDEEVEDELFPLQDHGPVSMELDAYIVSEEQAAEDEAEEEEEAAPEPPPKTRSKRSRPKLRSAQQAREMEKLEALMEKEKGGESEEPEPEEPADPEEAKKAKLHKKYMAQWKDTIGAPPKMRQRWQAKVTGGKRPHTKDWTTRDYEDAIELLKNGDWSFFFRSDEEEE